MRNAERLWTTAYWSSWADTLPMIREHHPRVADHTPFSLTQGRGGFHLEAAHESRDRQAWPQNGVMWTEANAQGVTWTTSSTVSLAWSGSPLPRLRPTKCSLAPCGRAWTPQTELWYDHREAQWRASRSSRHLSRPRPGSTLRASLSSCSGASSLCVLQLAGVASHLIHEVTTGELALTQGFLVAAGSRWKVALHESAERQAPGCRSTSVSKTWISIQGREQITAVWKWSPTVCLSSTAHSMLWTPRWSAQCELTDPPRAALDQARRTKERTYPELTGEQGRARLVVLACATGGRWSEEAQSFLRHLAREGTIKMVKRFVLFIPSVTESVAC